MNTEIDILKQFLSMSISSSEPVFEKFKELRNCEYHEKSGTQERFLYFDGEKTEKVVLVAHADTVWYNTDLEQHSIIEENGFFRGADGRGTGIGADDRAGCAILWILRDSGHSILILDGEEGGRIGSKWLMNEFPEIAKKINSHQFMIEFDRKNGKDFKCYNVGTDEFRKFIAKETGYSEPDRNSATDICTLCVDICGVNLSVGYYNEHRSNEVISISEWQNTLEISKNLLKKDINKFKL